MEDIIITKITSFTEGIRKGYFNCLLQLLNRYDGHKGIKWTTSEIILDLEAMLKDIDTFIHWGADVNLLYIDHDKKGKPTKGKIVPPDVSYQDYKRSEAQKALIEVMKNGY